MNNKKMLPIGTVVMLEKGQHKLMIIGQYPIDEKAKIKYDYTAVFYPEGFMTMEQVFAFNNKDIKEIYSEGYRDENYDEWEKKIAPYIAKFERDNPND
jgi:hypothetical protein